MLQYDVKAKYRLILESSWTGSFSSECSLNQPKAMCVCIRLISRSNHSICVCLFFLFYSRVFISRSYENHSIPRMFFHWETSWVVAPNVGCFLRLTFWWSQTFPLNHLDPRGTLLILSCHVSFQNWTIQHPLTRLGVQYCVQLFEYDNHLCCNHNFIHKMYV